MEQRIKTYETKLKSLTSDKKFRPSAEIWQYHRAMLADFQHERLIHLIVMFFFIFIMLVLLAFDCILTCCWAPGDSGIILTLWPLHLIVLILFITSVAYVRHYYFLENHIQALYDYNEKLSGAFPPSQKA